ncbi:MAG: hypothetical protein JWQ48_2150 [Conexibacter sp.]|nr:hypothetical protein [Conexibacter sp.]
MRVRMIGGGTADWDKPVQIGAGQWRATYRAYIATRYEFENGRAVHVKVRYAGVDDVNADGAVSGGFGHVEGQDEDGDALWGRVDWEVVPGYQGGNYHHLGGTGKWEGCSGVIRAPVWDQPQEIEMPMPPTEAFRNYGFIDGEGELDVPHLR